MADHPKPPRCKRPDESTEDYRVAMGWDEPPALNRLRSLRVLLGIDSPETRGWAPAVQQAARRTIDAAIDALRHNACSTEPQWGPILDALDGVPNDLRPEIATLDRLIRAEHERTLSRIDAQANASRSPLGGCPRAEKCAEDGACLYGCGSRDTSLDRPGSAIAGVAPAAANWQCPSCRLSFAGDHECAAGVQPSAEDQPKGGA